LPPSYYSLFGFYFQLSGSFVGLGIVAVDLGLVALNLHFLSDVVAGSLSARTVQDWWGERGQSRAYR
jgi:hypothetical protein